MLTMGGVMLAMFLSALDQTVVGTAMPRIITDLGGFDKFTWVTTAYLVASTTAVPIVGRLSDIYGRKRFYIAGIIIFLIGSVLAGLSQTINQLIVFRAIQGLGGGVIMALSFVAIADLFPPEERGKYQGLIAGVFGLSSVIGPTLGGFITDNLSWNWIFWINVPLAVPVVVLFVKLFPESRLQDDGENQRLDYMGMIALILGLVPLLFALSWGGAQYEWGSPQVIGALVLGGIMSVAFVFIEARAEQPIMPLDIYKNRMVSVSLIAGFLTGFGMFGAIIFIPLFFQGVLGASATSSGSFLTPMMLGIVFGAAISGQILSRTGGHYRAQALVGTAILTTGMFLISQMNEDTSFVRAVFNIVIMGFGMGTTFPTFTLAVQNSVPFRIIGVATSATQFFRSVGGMLGLAILGAVMANRFAANLSSNLPDAVTQSLQPGQLEAFRSNPQALINPEAMTALRAGFEQAGPEGAIQAEQLLVALRASLAQAIGDIFLVTVAILALSFIVTIFLSSSTTEKEEKAPGIQSEPTPAD